MDESSPANMAIAVTRFVPSRPSKQGKSAKMQHGRAMRASVMGGPTERAARPSQDSRAQQIKLDAQEQREREEALRAFILNDPELATVANSICAKNLEAVIAGISNKSMNSLDHDRQFKSTIPRSMFAGGSAERPIILDLDDVGTQSNEEVQETFPQRIQQAPPASAMLSEQNAGSTMLDPPIFQFQTLTMNSPKFPASGAELNAMDNHRSQENPKLELSDPIVASQASRMADAASTQPLTKKQRAAARDHARDIQVQPVTITKAKRRKRGKKEAKQEKHRLPQERIQKAKREKTGETREQQQKRRRQAAFERTARKQGRKQAREAQQPPAQKTMAPGSWQDCLSAQVSHVRRSLFARAKDEMHTHSRSYPVVIEALELVVADLTNEAALYRSAPRVNITASNEPALRAAQPNQAIPSRSSRVGS